MMNKIKVSMTVLVIAVSLVCSVLTGCSESKTADESSVLPVSAETDILGIVNPKEKAAVDIAVEKVQKLGREPRIIATSPAIADVCDKMEIDLVGVCGSNISVIPERYKDTTVVGLAMSPDIEIVSSLKPDWILSPVSLQSDLQPKYEAVGSDWAFLNTRSVQGLYRSINELGEIFGKQEQAQAAIKEFTDFYDTYKSKNEGRKHPKVMILMGLPGSYIIATENSYVGSLVEMAGGENVYAGTNEEFLTVNTDDMKTKTPDIILRCAHALPDSVMAMFDKEFAENDIWKHFEAVQKGKVYDLSYNNFGMSAKFNYPDALNELQPILYPEGENQ